MRAELTLQKIHTRFILLWCVLKVKIILISYNKIHYYFMLIYEILLCT
jgi:hypothetical protein